MSRAPSIDFRWLVAIAAALNLAMASAWVLTTVSTGDNLVRLRNSLGVQIGELSDFTWLPEAPPPGFLQGTDRAAADLTDVARGIEVGDGGDRSGGFPVGLALSRDLMRAPKRVDGAVNAPTLETYRAIVQQGRGYCGDFVKAFAAVALAKGVPVRQWGFAFDGFGSGHTFNEVYDTTLGKWVLIDSFHSLYFVDPVSREPLSTLEVHDRLLAVGPVPHEVEVVRIAAERVPFRTDQLAIDYYRRGMSQLWMVWGNNTLDYEASFAGRIESALHRSVGQLIGILTGRYPVIRVYPVAMSRRDYRLLLDTRREFVMAATSLAVSVAFALYVAVRLRRRRRSSF